MCFKSIFQALFGCCLPRNKNGVRNGFLRFSYRLICHEFQFLLNVLISIYVLFFSFHSINYNEKKNLDCS